MTERIGILEKERRRAQRHREDGTPDPARESAKRIAERMKPPAPPAKRRSKR